MNKISKLRTWFSREQLLATAQKPRVKKTGLVLFALFVATILALFFAGPPLLKSYLTETLSQQIGRKVSVGAIKVNPFTLSVTLQNLNVLDLDGKTPYISFREIYVNAQLASLVFVGPVLSEVKVVAPYLHVVRYPDESYNFEKSPGPLLQHRAEVKKGESKPLSFSINNIQISEGKIEFDDQPKNRRHEIRDLKIAIPFLSNLFYRVDDYVQPAFSAVVNGAPLQLTGQSKPFDVDRESSLQLKLRQLSLGEYLTYVPKKVHFTLPGGTLDADLKIAFLQPANAAPTLRVSGTTTLHDLVLHEAKDTPTLRLKRLDVTLDSLALFLKRFTISRIAASEAELFVRRDSQGRINLANLVEPEERKDPLPHFLIKEITLDQTMVHVRDAYRARPFETTLKDLKFSAHNITSEKAKAGQLTLRATGPGESAFQAAADVVLEPLALSKMSAELTNLRLPQPIGKGDMARIGRFAVSGGALDLERKSASIEQVTLAGSQFNVQRNKQGQLNLSALADKSQAQPAAPAEPADAKSAWQYALNKILLDDVGVQWRDEVPADTATLGLDKIQAQVEGISSAPKSSAKLALKAQMAKSGKLAIDGDVVLAPLSAKLKLDARGLPILPLQPYFADQVHITVSSGNLSARGNLDVQLAQTARVQYRGTLQIHQFASVDHLNRNDFLKWETLSFGELNVTSEPLNVAIGEIALSNFYSRLIINPDGTLNVQHVAGKESGSAQSVAGETAKSAPEAKVAEAGAAPKTAPLPIKIGRITLQGGQVNFSDRFIKPNYSANLTQIGGSIVGLSPDLASTATVEMRGKVDDAAPVEILGKVNPLAGNLFLDLKASAKGVDLPTTTPYSARYAGYPIIKGKLSMDVKYHIEDKKLSAENHVILDQLTFGEKVESPDATKLPVLLAVALLRDRNGVIDINLPISGSLDDPQFSVGGIVVQVIVNLIGKALTSPFALLGSLFPNSEQLSYIEFEAGQARLDAAATNKIQNLAHALDQRPGLKLDITGRVDPQQDKEGLRQASMTRKVKTVKFENLSKQGTPPASLDAVKVEPAEYPKLLKEAYSREKFAKPRNAIGLAKDLPVPEMEKLMLANAAISDDDLRQLALRRARVVADALAKTGKVTQDRVFVLEPKLTAEPKEKLKDSRVDFSLK